MIRHLRGRVLFKEEGGFVLEVGGVGFYLQAPEPFLREVREGEEVAVHTHLLSREEGLFLYAFPDGESHRLFGLLLSVSGVGPKVALALLSALGPRLLAQALAEGDVKLLASASGVGKRLAERIALELKGKVLPPSAPAAQGAAVEEAVLALLALGFREGAARAAVLEALSKAPSAKAQDLIKEALKKLR